MYQSILVPLDGSKLAECVLPHAEELGKGCSVPDIVLVTVTERVMVHRYLEDKSQPLGGRMAAEGRGKMEAQAQRYLGRIAKRLEAKGVKVKTEVLLGEPAEEITFYAEQHPCNLILMASHGRSGPSRWAHGSVAEKVFRATCVPILMVRAPGCPVAA